MTERKQPLAWRIRFLFGCLLFIGCVRTFDVMLIRGASFRSIADDNRLFDEEIVATRGVFTDRHNNQLVINSPVFFSYSADTSNLLFPAREQELTASEAARLASQDPGRVGRDYQRVYPFTPALTHLLGYTGFVTIDPLTMDRAASHKEGKLGLEKVFEKRLAGTAGVRTFETSATGQRQRLVTETAPRPGEDIALTIDAKLSKVAFDALAPQAGAVIVTEVETGQLLVLVSSPSYDPATISAALTDPGKPMINRALAAYPPGSTFKLVTAIAALDTGKMSTATEVVDEGQITVGQQVFGNWFFRQYGRTEGSVGIIKAIARSNDIFFYHAAQAVGPETLSKYASLLGFERTSGVGFIEEKKGLLPTPAWKEQRIGEKWYLGDTYHYGIGQGFVLATPLQVNMMTAAVARRGEWCGLVIERGSRPQCEVSDIKQEAIETTIQGMVQACSTGGTAFPFFPDNEALPAEQKIACKTGTAEFGQSDAKGHKKTHAWLTMFYPQQKPKVAITVLLESSEALPFAEGSKDAGPIARKVWQAWREGNEK